MEIGPNHSQTQYDNIKKNLSYFLLYRETHK